MVKINPGDCVEFIDTIMPNYVAIVVNGRHLGFVTKQDADRIKASFK